MITKTKFWEKIKKELKEVERSKKFTEKVINKIKGIPQNENKTRET
jgi:hypothetical protein|tara:strand:- start:1018 stop:1155 length:138 start_codon:yes stop_codon:yes gene_type:complete